MHSLVFLNLFFKISDDFHKIILLSPLKRPFKHVCHSSYLLNTLFFSELVLNIVKKH